MKNGIDAVLALLKKNRDRVFYYGGVALVLVALALAAESYMSSAPEELVAPATEVTALLERLREPEIIYPEGMRLLRGYSAQPEWNGQLGQWECHEAADYQLRDNAVLCLQTGTVRAVGENGVYGGFVEIDCGGRLYRYASIMPESGISEGDTIEAGDVIGTADESMPAEQMLGAHLHLEMLENGSPADFETLYAKNEG